MKILIFHYDELDELGGVESLVRTMSREFTAMGNPTGVVELGHRGAAKRQLMPDVPIWRVAGSSFPALSKPRSWFSHARSVRQFQNVVNEFNPDIVHVHFPVHQALTVVGACRFPRRWRLAVTVHNSDIRGEPQSDPRIRLWRNRLFGCADAITAVSDSLLAEAKQAYPAIADKGSVIYNGIGADWGDSGYPSDLVPAGKFVLYAGRLSTVKSVDTLLSAWSLVGDAASDTTLLVVGDGSERQTLENQARALGILESVSFLPSQGKEALAALYQHAECVVLPSQREGLAMVLLEAGACGAICVASDVTGIYEVIKDGINGFLFPYGDIAAQAAALNTLFELTEKARNTMKEAAKQRVMAQFTQQKMLDNYLGLYQRLMPSGTPSK